MHYSFKSFMIEKAMDHQSKHLEAIFVLRKIVDMIDDGHVNYSKDKLSFNVGSLIHDKKYSNLDIHIIQSKDNSVSLGRHKSEEKHALFIKTTDYPSRETIDSFLQKEEHIHKFKEAFNKFLNDADIDITQEYEGSQKEQSKKINTREEFEQLYNDITAKLSEVLSQYKKAQTELENRYKKASNDLGEKEIIQSSMNKLKKNMLGSNVNEFKSKALKIIDDKFKLLNKEYKDKLLSRLENFYENNK